MSVPDPLQQCLLALSAAAPEAAPLIVAGGYGLYLKQGWVVRSGVRTLLPTRLLPENRATNDIDLILRAEVVVSADRMRSVRGALDRLGFTPVPGSEYLQFAKPVLPAGAIKIDLLVGPLGDLFDPGTVKLDDRRVRPRGFGGLHAHPLDEAVGVEEHALALPLGESPVRVHVPQPFTYLLMKLLAFRDRCDDERKDMARHHALDVYRIVALTTTDEDPIVRRFAAEHRDHPRVVEARGVAQRYFAAPDSLGILRLREHPLYFAGMDLDALRRELREVLPPVGE